VAFDSSLSEFTQKELEKRGVLVLTNTAVQNIDEKGVHLKFRSIGIIYYNLGCRSAGNFT
jgi:NADH dehydrogenase FAD-containing subunit